MISLYCIKTTHPTRLPIQTLIAAVLLLFAQLTEAQSYIEGKHFAVVNNAARLDSKEVVEFFSFSCPGCYAIEPLLDNMEQAMPNVNVRRVHMSFGGRNAKQSQQVFVLMTLLKAEQHKSAIFERIHVKRDIFDTDEEVINFFAELGYERKLVEQLARSFTADTKLRKMNKEATSKRISSVPTIIVNGKYQVILNSIASANDFDQLILYLYGLPK